MNFVLILLTGSRFVKHWIFTCPLYGRARYEKNDLRFRAINLFIYYRVESARSEFKFTVIAIFAKYDLQ